MLTACVLCAFSFLICARFACACALAEREKALLRPEVEHWFGDFPQSTLNMLAASGVRELYALGRRITARFPSIFRPALQETNAKLGRSPAFIRSDATWKPRTQQSRNAFLRGILDGFSHPPANVSSSFSSESHLVHFFPMEEHMPNASGSHFSVRASSDGSQGLRCQVREPASVCKQPVLEDLPHETNRTCGWNLAQLRFFDVCDRYLRYVEAKGATYPVDCCNWLSQ